MGIIEALDNTADLRARLASAERLAASYSQTAIETAIAFDEREVAVRDALAELRAEIERNQYQSIATIFDREEGFNEGIDLAIERLDATIARLCPGAEGDK